MWSKRDSGPHAGGLPKSSEVETKIAEQDPSVEVRVNEMMTKKII
jgi:hypothetical protein